MTKNTGKYKCIIVDDDELDRIMIAGLVKKYAFLEIFGVYESAVLAAQEARDTDLNVLFLDIKMGGMSGLDLRKDLMNHVGACIFISSYPEYAVEGFEVDALDYMLKPISSERFGAAMQRLWEYLEIKRKSELFDCSLNGDAIFIKVGHESVKIKTHEIVCLEALKDYTKIVTSANKYCVLCSLGNLLTKPPFLSFVRIHRSYAVQKHYVKKVTATQVEIASFKLPIGRSYKDMVRNLIVG